MDIGVSKISRIISFPDLLSLCLQIIIWYLLCFVIPRHRSSLSLVSIHWFFPKLWPMDLEKYHELSLFRTFFSLLTDNHLISGLSTTDETLVVEMRIWCIKIGNVFALHWYSALPYQYTDQVWVWFWSIRISQSYGPWTYKNIKNCQFFALL
jgi:hypothetical protein